MIDPNDLPPAVRNLLVDLPPDREEHLAELLAASAEHAEMVRGKAPYAFISGAGETITAGALSPGCQACKAGTWDCLFLTMDCNLSCSFCCSPGERRNNIPLSAFGKDASEALKNFHLIQPEGISFSGGEVFLEFERLRHLVALMRREFPLAYLWVYTNGFLASAEKTAELGQCAIETI